MLLIKVKTRQNKNGEDDLDNLEAVLQAMLQEFKVNRRRCRKEESGARDPGPKFRFYSTPIIVGNGTVGTENLGKVQVLDEFGD
jgi:hypothetical protein